MKRTLLGFIGTLAGFLLVVLAASPYAVGAPAIGAELGYPTLGAGLFLELSVTSRLSFDVGLGVQSASLMIKLSTTFSFAHEQALVPYLGVGSRFLITRESFNALLSLLGGVRFQLGRVNLWIEGMGTMPTDFRWLGFEVWGRLGWRF